MKPSARRMIEDMTIRHFVAAIIAFHEYEVVSQCSQGVSFLGPRTRMALG